MKRKTDEQFKYEVYELVGNEYTFLESYIGSMTKLRIEHNKCGNTYKVSPNNFLNGSRCPYCFGNIKKTDEDFKHEVYTLVGNEYVFLEPYQGAMNKIKVRHNECGNVYEVRPNKFICGNRCPYCRSRKDKKTDEEFRKEIYDLVGNEYLFLEPYQGALVKIKVRHDCCGNTYEVSPSNFIRGIRCPYCSGNHKKTDEEFKKEVYDLVGDEYTFLEHYQGSTIKIKVKHNKCGNVYEVQPSIFLFGIRCPYCKSPKGEIFISKILDNLNLNYESQKTFKYLKDKDYLSYDFYIPDQNILIEYQGIQHYQPVDYFGGETKFKNQQKHDQMKLDYAKEHGYNLIAVPYTEDTFSKIKKYLIKHGLK